MIVAKGLAVVATLLFAFSFGDTLVTVEHLVMAVVGLVAVLVISARIQRLADRLDKLERPPTLAPIPFAGKRPAPPGPDYETKEPPPTPKPPAAPKRKRRS